MTARPSPASALALGAWALNLVGIAGFSWVLFGRKWLDGARGVSVGMVASASAAATTAAFVDRRAAYADLPPLGWMLFAGLLQEEVWRRNA